MKKLQGTWKVAAFEVGGMDQTAKGPKAIVMKGDEFRGLAPNVKFHIDPATTPRTGSACRRQRGLAKLE